MRRASLAWRWVGAAALAAGILGGAVAGGRLLAVGETRPHAHVLGEARESWTSTAAAQPPLLSYIPTYHKDVRPILEKSCAGCHVEGGIAPFALTGVKEATSRARQIQFAVQDKRMPPWMPGGDSPRFLHETRLSDDEIAVIANWAWAGAPEGKPVAGAAIAARPPAPAPDLTVDIGRDFEPAEGLSDEYRCFIIDSKVERERFLAGYDIAPGNRAIVHHVILFQVTGAYVAQAEALEKADDGRGGYTCFGGVGVGPTVNSRVSGGSSSSGPNTVGYIGSWVPGSQAVKFPDGVGVLMRPGSRIVAQVHYNLAAGRGLDRTAAKLYLAPEDAKLKPLRLSTLLAPVEVPCPGPYPADPSDPCHREAAYKSVAKYQDAALTELLRSGLLLTYCKASLSPSVNGASGGRSVTSCDFPLNDNRTALGVQGHMHVIGSQVKVEANPGTPRARTLLDIPRWDFHWQSGYWFAEPVELSRGDTLRVTCTFENTPERQAWLGGRQGKPRYLVWGEGTNDEMCLAGVLAVTR